MCFQILNFILLLLAQIFSYASRNLLRISVRFVYWVSYDFVSNIYETVWIFTVFSWNKTLRRIAIDMQELEISSNITKNVGFE